MKDAYSFDADEEGREDELRDDAPAPTCRIFDRMGLTYRMVQADSGAIGGTTSAEFQVLVDSGEDAIVACDTCDYAANVEVGDGEGARRRRDATPEASAIAKVHTPGHGSIEEVDQVPRRDAEGDAQVAPVRGRRARSSWSSCAAITR